MFVCLFIGGVGGGGGGGEFGFLLFMSLLFYQTLHFLLLLPITFTTQSPRGSFLSLYSPEALPSKTSSSSHTHTFMFPFLPSVKRSRLRSGRTWGGPQELAFLRAAAGSFRAYTWAARVHSGSPSKPPSGHGTHP